ncbi:MAG: hypothetical protein F4227_08835 [Gammaproteobacteria bacterium]|nr:hypothetical protein [Gammaproteobacteria bacterium]MYF03055.1 hypothetical protein [Gammaproteobacteria bacterium]MYI77208.1 hypothetical protein [Gammaproteobacteria bacterium]
MYSITLVRIFLSFIIFGLFLVQHAHSHPAGTDNQGFGFFPETEPFLPVTDEHRAAWTRVVEHCFPVNTRDSLSGHCLTSLGEFFANEPVWSYSEMYVYGGDGWLPLFHNRLGQRRNYSAADFLSADVPFWRDIFDHEIEQRQELFLRVVNDSQCIEITRNDNEGMQDHLAERCAVRELYKYATYLNACNDAHYRISWLQNIQQEWDVEPPTDVFDDKNSFEIIFLELDESVSNEALRSAAKRSLQKSYLHASWVVAQCRQHGFILKPGEIFGSYTSTDENLPWSIVPWKSTAPRWHDESKYERLLSHTHEFIMKMAIKSGDYWAIRSGYLGSSVIAEFSEDLMEGHPLLMHRTIGDSQSSVGFSLGLNPSEKALHRAKAYLLLVEEAGEEFARLEYDPAKLVEEIQYVESGGLLKLPLTSAEIEAKRRESIRKYEEEELIREAQGELFK